MYPCVKCQGSNHCSFLGINKELYLPHLHNQYNNGGLKAGGHSVPGFGHLSKHFSGYFIVIQRKDVEKH